MKLHMLAILTVALFAGQLSAQDKPLKKLEPIKKPDAAKQGEFKTIREKASYAFGLGLGENLKHQSVDIDVDFLARGMKDGIAGKGMFKKDEIEKIMQDFQAEQAEASKKAEEVFFASNKKKEGVKTLPSGLQYKVLKKGTGRKATIDDIFTANYRGTLLNGVEFDSSYERGEPLKLPVRKVIPGWTEALQLMDEGSKWELYVPSKLAYGEQGSPPVIAPNSALIFEMELLKVEAPASKLPRLKTPDKGAE